MLKRPGFTFPSRARLFRHKVLHAAKKITKKAVPLSNPYRQAEFMHELFGRYRLMAPENLPDGRFGNRQRWMRGSAKLAITEEVEKNAFGGYYVLFGGTLSKIFFGNDTKVTSEMLLKWAGRNNPGDPLGHAKSVAEFVERNASALQAGANDLGSLAKIRLARYTRRFGKREDFPPQFEEEVTILENAVDGLGHINKPLAENAKMILEELGERK